jgi:hypothetical protein
MRVRCGFAKKGDDNQLQIIDRTAKKLYVHDERLLFQVGVSVAIDMNTKNCCVNEEHESDNIIIIME